MFDLSQLSAAELPLHTLAMLFLYFVLGLYAIFSAILYYHWREFSTDPKVTGFTLITYFGTTLPLLLIMAILAFVIN